MDARQTGRDETERQQIAEQIAIGALRYFMLKFTRNSVIAFDFKDALSFEGETGPYIQYAVVRIRSIFRKGGRRRSGARGARESAVSESAGQQRSQHGEIAIPERRSERRYLGALAARRRFSLILDQCIAAPEPAFVAKHAFQLAQEFANFYHRHHILTEEDPERKTSCWPQPRSCYANWSGRWPCSGLRARKRCSGGLVEILATQRLVEEQAADPSASRQDDNYSLPRIAATGHQDWLHK